MSRDRADAAGPTAAVRGAIYRIRAEGEIESSWTDRLCGLEIAARNGIATLRGPLRDQSELIGVLNALHMLRLTVTSVERLDANEATLNETEPVE